MAEKKSSKPKPNHPWKAFNPGWLARDKVPTFDPLQHKPLRLGGRTR